MQFLQNRLGLDLAQATTAPPRVSGRARVFHSINCAMNNNAGPIRAYVRLQRLVSSTAWHDSNTLPQSVRAPGP